MSLAFEKHAPEMQKLWDTMRIIQDASSLHNTATKIKQYQHVYEAVEKVTGVPWQLVACKHVREAGSADIGVWKGVLHNGQKIVGTNKKTTIVPKGMGPFNKYPTDLENWKDAAVHALKRMGFDKVTDWTPGKMCAAAETFNGYGYRNKGLRSPYVWGSTNHEQLGKYIRDHVFDPSVEDTQVGVAALLKFLGVGQKSSVAKTVTKTTVGGTAAGGAVVASVSYWDQLKEFVINHQMELALGTLATIALVLFVRRILRKANV
jgi:lysozyme family protein